MSKLALFLNPNFEEIEAVTIIDLLRRANIDVDTFSTNANIDVLGAQKIIIKADDIFDNFDLNNYEGIILPGGEGVNQWLDDSRIIQIVQETHNESKLVAAICAAPQILGKANIVHDKKIVNYPGCDLYLKEANLQTAASEIDGNIITGSSPGTAIPFALNIIKYVAGEQESIDIAKQLVIR